MLRDPDEPVGSPRAWRLYYTSIISASYRRFMCLAFSADGIVWQKPELGIVSFNGSSATNIVYPTSENYTGRYQVGNVFVDEGLFGRRGRLHGGHCVTAAMLTRLDQAQPGPFTKGCSWRNNSYREKSFQIRHKAQPATTFYSRIVTGLAQSWPAS